MSHKNGKTIRCENKKCNKEIYLSFSRIGRRKFCNAKCRLESGWYNLPHEKRYSNWTGGRIERRGYVYIISREHPNRDPDDYMAEHRLVMEKILGRYLTSNEQVHHRNGIRNDNRPENLEVVLRKMHYGNVKCPHCLKEFKVK